ncbi:ATP-dependent DNA helicase RRM3-like [Lotus japonicus]|uniref:ATP-dependent DNA helicase RRM3-like n=1 Tax=Lotus japonicus TaxID=34305 RepID=UPI00258C286C|nr:ATP-dependent DNA helicase RRM3-like [Lotus japonicus]
MVKIHDELVSSLTSEQKIVYKNVLDVVLSDNDGFFFLYGFGGTGKIFVWNTLSAALRSRGLTVLNVASSGIASLLLPGGRTAHSTFSILISINEISTCNLRHGSQKAELLKKASLIIWDEAPMLNKHCFEALDRSLNDIMKTQFTHGYDIPFGGKVVVLGGDFRQILPVISKGSRSEIVGSAINSSYLWKHCKCKEPLLELVNFAYPKLANNLQKNSFFQERAIIAPTLECVEEINNFMLAMIPGDETEYLSCDTPCKSDEDSGVNAEWFTSEFLNDFKCYGIPNHAIKLKAGVPIMLI